MARSPEISTASPITKAAAFIRSAGAGLLFAATLCGCSSLLENTMPGVGDLLNYSLDSSPSIPRENAAAVPYASLGVRVEDGPQQMVILAGRLGSSLLWTTPNRIALETHDGRIVRTAGFEHNLSNVEFEEPDPLIAVGGIPSRTMAADRMVSFADINKYAVRLHCQLQNLGSRRIVVLEARRSAILVKEHCTASDLEWEFTNRFWIDEKSGTVWQSQQYVHPEMPPIELQVFRPVGGG